MTPEEKLEFVKKDIEMMIWHCCWDRTTSGGSYMQGYTAALLDLGNWLKHTLKELEK